MRIYDIIEKKRDGGALSHEETAFFVRGAADGSIPDYQLSALLMAIYIRGMSDEETASLTKEMALSGEVLDLSRFGTRSVDKHSTGGVGDKTTLIVAPIVASLGAYLAKMSGRGLGHTGGTVDKLESIPDTRVEIGGEEFISIAEKTGICVIGAGKELDPADKKLYSLRDVTATVGSIPLMVSSIMSKKLAGGAANIVLDVKCGSGSFMKTPEAARLLAQKMVKIGSACGKNVSAVITNMDIPLGHSVGNRLEVLEAVGILQGRDKGSDLYRVSLALAAEMVRLSLGMSHGDSVSAVTSAIDSGKAYAKFIEWISAQGGDADAIEKDGFCTCAYCRHVKAPVDGYISSINTEDVGIAAVMLGAGRRVSTDRIDPCAGIIISKKTGDRVSKGDTLAVLYTNNESSLDGAEQKYIGSHVFSDEACGADPLIYDTVRG